MQLLCIVLILFNNHFHFCADKRFPDCERQKTKGLQGVSYQGNKHNKYILQFLFERRTFALTLK
jgi:hypothetical protein